MAKLDTNTVSILVAIIGIFGLLAPSLFSNYLLNKADVDVGIEFSSENKTISEIKLTNDGLGIAKNITLLMKNKFYNFSTIQYESGTSDVFIYPYNKSSSVLQLDIPTPIDARFFKIKIPILYPGIGSPIHFIVDLTRPQNISQYEFALSHEQGSTNVFSKGPFDDTFSKVLFYKTYYIGLLIVIIVATIVFFVIRRNKNIIDSLRKELFNIYNELKEFPNSVEKFEDFLNLWKIQNHTSKLKKYSNDYILIDDLYFELKERNNIISTINSNIINKKFVTSVEKCLKTIDWTKY